MELCFYCGVKYGCEKINPKSDKQFQNCFARARTNISGRKKLDKH
jgi:hypothetical protein